MKKYLSLLLVLCLLILACFAISSCETPDVDPGNEKAPESTSEETVKKDPVAAVGGASDRTFSELFPDDMGFGDVVAEALKSGAFSISFDLDEEVAGTDISVLEKIYFNQNDKKYVSDTSVNVAGETYAGRIFIDKNGIAVNSSDILGSNKTLLLNLSTFITNFKTGPLAQMMIDSGADQEDVQLMLDMLTNIKAEYDKLFSDDLSEQQKANLDAYAAMLKQTVTSETVDGVKYTVISYTINNKALKDIINDSVDKIQLPEEMKSELFGSIDETLASLDQTASINIVAKVYINNEANKINKITLGGTIAPVNVTDVEPIELEAALAFASNEIKLTISGSADGEDFVADVTLARKTEGDNNVYTLVVNAGDNNGGNINALNASITHNKNTGALVIAADIYNNGEDRMEVALNGSLKVTDTTATLAFTSATAMGQTVEFNIAFTFEKAATMPAMPDGAIDISTMTKADFEALINEIQTNSKLAELFAQ